MKRKLICTLFGVAMAGSLVSGCAGKTGAAAGGAAPTTAAPAAAASTEAPAAAASANAAPESAAPASSNEGMNIEIVSKGFQHQYWQAVLKGSQQKAAELGVTITFVGPNSESDIADQLQMFQSAINKKPAALGLAALDTEALLDAIAQAQAQGIPIVGFDSGVPGAPEGAIVANASTDNYAAGELAAEESYKAALKERIAGAGGPVRIGVMGQDATAESIVNRGLGFIDKIAELVQADGKTVTVEGNDRYVSDCNVEKKDGADVIIEIVVPAQVTSELSALDCQTLLNKPDTICIYGSNQHSGEGMVTGNANLNKFGTGADQVIGVTFDSGTVIKQAVKDKMFLGAVTQAPVAMGERLVELCVSAANGEKVSDIDTGCQWYTADTIDNPEIAQNLYD